MKTNQSISLKTQSQQHLGRIRELKKNHARCTEELEALRAKVETFDDEVENRVEESDLRDDAERARVSQMLLEAQVLPRRIAKLEAQVLDLEGQLSEALNPVRDLLHEIFRPSGDDLLEKATNAFKPFFKNIASARQAARETDAWRAHLGRISNSLHPMLNSLTSSETAISILEKVINGDSLEIGSMYDGKT